ncbi:hypothetical protein KO504_17075 [Winogradskyella psychrotolerans]|uniref:hypothetical protein n=1 Tax=Winogradskyella psychrotolerans TaxID=1344585 RepID=UPI001C068B5C|nr:hypothetical protein [Winogradskyella psychrotolerans]MBU2923065.1 hypothetical protein [Winogradskyella psychrotolerans]
MKNNKIDVNANQWAMARHANIAQFINVVVVLTFYFNEVNLLYGLLFVILGYSFFEFAQKKWFEGKNNFMRQFLTVFASIISYGIYAGIITVITKV